MHERKGGESEEKTYKKKKTRQGVNEYSQSEGFIGLKRGSEA